MADTYKTLTSVDTVTSLDDTDYIVVNDGDTVKQVTKGNLLSELTSTVSSYSSAIASNTSDISDIDTRVTTLEGGTITTDTTLSVSGMAADAEVVGDLKSDVNDVSYRLETFDGDIYINDDDFELGNIGMSSSGWTYSSSSTRVRSKEGTTYTLQAGDVISLSDYTDARFYVGSLASDGTYGSIGWLTSDYEVPIDGSYVLLMSNITETSQTSKDDLLSLLSIQRDDNALNDIEQLESDIDGTITVVTGTNILNQDDVNVGYLFGSNGANVANSSYTTTPYYSLASGESVSLNLFRKFIAISTINNTVLSFVDSYTTNYTYTATSDCKFKICFLTSALSTVQIEYGTSCTTYEDYYTYTQLSETLYSSKRLLSEWYLQRNPNVLSIAHQGYNVNAPKQTLSAYEETREQGFDIAECDINCTSDGYIICCHNEIVYADTTNMVINQSLTSASGDYTTAITIADSTLATLQTYSWGTWMSSDYADETVPLFEDVLAICKKTGLKLFIDDFARAITDGYSSDVYDLIDKYGMRDNVLFVTSNSDPNSWNSEATHVISSSTYDSSLLTSLAEYIEWYPDSEIILSLNYSLIDSTVSQSVHALGVKLFAWTVDAVSDYEAMLPYVDGIISNNLSFLNYYLSNRT